MFLMSSLFALVKVTAAKFSISEVNLNYKNVGMGVS